MEGTRKHNNKSKPPRNRMGFDYHIHWFRLSYSLLMLSSLMLEQKKVLHMFLLHLSSYFITTLRSPLLYLGYSQSHCDGQAYNSAQEEEHTQGSEGAELFFHAFLLSKTLSLPVFPYRCWARPVYRTSLIEMGTMVGAFSIQDNSKEHFHYINTGLKARELQFSLSVSHCPESFL